MMRMTAAALAASILAGCASFSPDGGMGTVSDLTKERTGEPVRAHRSAGDTSTADHRRDEILKQPLTADSAVELALLNNRGLQASFAQLGIAESALVEAGRLRNPVLSFGRMALGGGAVEIERSVMFDVLGLLTMPAAQQVQQRNFEQAQYQAAYEAVGIAADTRRAYFSAVAAQELVTYYRQVKDAADVSNDLAKRMVVAGNWRRCANRRSTPTPPQAWRGRCTRPSLPGNGSSGSWGCRASR
jgi:hypothetical protein